jgi:hypothetical protein
LLVPFQSTKATLEALQSAVFIPNLLAEVFHAPLQTITVLKEPLSESSDESCHATLKEAALTPLGEGLTSNPSQENHEETHDYNQ